MSLLKFQIQKNKYVYKVRMCIEAKIKQTVKCSISATVDMVKQCVV